MIVGLRDALTVVRRLEAGGSPLATALVSGDGAFPRTGLQPALEVPRGLFKFHDVHAVRKPAATDSGNDRGAGARH